MNTLLKTLVVIVVDDDGMTVRNGVLTKYFQKYAKRHNMKLELRIFTKFPKWCDFLEAHIISWDSDLGNGIECIRKVRELQMLDTHLFEMTFDHKIHIIHSLNAVASGCMYEIFAHDLDAETYILPFNQMEKLVEM